MLKIKKSSSLVKNISAGINNVCAVICLLEIRKRMCVD